MIFDKKNEMQKIPRTLSTECMFYAYSLHVVCESKFLCIIQIQVISFLEFTPKTQRKFRKNPQYIRKAEMSAMKI